MIPANANAHDKGQPEMDNTASHVTSHLTTPTIVHIQPISLLKKKELSNLSLN